MPFEPLHHLPHEAIVPLHEIRVVVIQLDELHERMEAAQAYAWAAQVDWAIGRMMRWLWDLLRELDEEADRG